jgi:hypothetical protein
LLVPKDIEPASLLFIVNPAPVATKAVPSAAPVPVVEFVNFNSELVVPFRCKPVPPDCRAGLVVPIPALPVTVKSALEPEMVNDPVISASPL